METQGGRRRKSASANTFVKKNGGKPRLLEERMEGGQSQDCVLEPLIKEVERRLVMVLFYLVRMILRNRQGLNYVLVAWSKAFLPRFTNSISTSSSPRALLFYMSASTCSNAAIAMPDMFYEVWFITFPACNWICFS